MKYRIITPATAYPCDLDFLKDQLRITHNAHDSILNSYIIAATETAILETGRQLNYAALQGISKYAGERYFIIERGPVKAVSKVEYLNLSGNLVEIISAQYDLQMDEYGASIFLTDDFVLTNPNLSRPDAIRISFTAGWGKDLTDPFPELIRNAVAMKASRFYTNPDDGVDGKVTVSQNLLRSIACPIV